MMAGFIGTLGSGLLSPLVAAAGYDLSAAPAWLILVGLVWLIPLSGQIGMNPILIVSLIGPMLPEAAAMGVSPSAIILAKSAFASTRERNPRRTHSARMPTVPVLGTLCSCAARRASRSSLAKIPLRCTATARQVRSPAPSLRDRLAARAASSLSSVRTGSPAPDWVAATR